MNTKEFKVPIPEGMKIDKDFIDEPKNVRAIGTNSCIVNYDAIIKEN